jgi:hypothetical protein
MDPHYRHTQIGWVTLGSILGGAALTLVLLGGIRALPGASLVALFVMLVGLLFATLTVEVDAQELRASFSGGIVRKRITLADLRRYRELRNPWYYGWGIHKLRGGWIWNVSGFDAVELVLADGSVWRIGTDEPAAVARALASVAPHAASGHPGQSPATPPARRGPWFAVAAGAAVVAGTVAFVTPFYLQTRDPKVSVTPQRLSIESLFYGQDYRLDEVTSVSLESRLPRVLLRTNGFAGGGLLRGWFSVEGLGKGKLFVDAGNGPFVLVRLRSGFVIVNFGSPEKTRALYEELKATLRAAGAPSR